MKKLKIFVAVFICFLLMPSIKITAETDTEAKFYELYDEFVAIEYTIGAPTHEQLFWFEDPVAYGIDSSFDGFMSDYPKPFEEYADRLNQILDEMKSLDSSQMPEPLANACSALIEKRGASAPGFEGMRYRPKLDTIIEAPELMYLTDFTTDLHFESYVAILEDYDTLADEIEKNLGDFDSNQFALYADVCVQMASDPNKPVLAHLKENIGLYGGDKDVLLSRAEASYEENFIPTVLRIKTMLEEAIPTDDNDAAVYIVNPEQYAKEVQEALTTDSSIDEIYDYLVKAMGALRGYIWEFETNPENAEALATANLLELTPEEYMQRVREMYDADLPYQNSPEPIFKILPRYLMILGADGVLFPQKLDSSDRMIFITHEESATPGLKSYELIAHEGYPGHYYFYYIFSELFENPHLGNESGNSRTSEAWAEYIASATLGAAVDNEKVGDYIIAQHLLDRVYAGLVEIGVKYYDWNDDEFYDFYKDVLGYVTIDPQYFENSRSDVRSETVTMLTYVYYPVKIFEMRHTLETEGVFNAPDFHWFLLDNFYRPFDEIEEVFYTEYLPEKTTQPITEIPDTGNYDMDRAAVVIMLLSGFTVILSRKRRLKNIHKTS
ncbi:MAG: DUF885 family protein [Ruminococcus sp.]|jgi:hypothetical protein|nr:DUF885 family protein [Ruminococcus sp.]